MPFSHSESLEDQDYALELAKARDAPNLAWYQMRRDEVANFGRIPARNVVLGRRPTEEERLYLKPVKKVNRRSTRRLGGA